MVGKYVAGALTAVGLFLAACAPAPIVVQPGTTPEEVQRIQTQQQVRQTCTGYTALLLTLTFNIDSLSREQKETIVLLNAAVEPVCSDIEGVDNLDEALVRVNDGLRRLQTIRLNELLLEE